MHKIIFGICSIAITGMLSCNKATNRPVENIKDLEQTVLADFSEKVAVAGYKDLDNAAIILQSSINNLNSSATEANLDAARTAWKNMRLVWEQCEGFIFGPVEDNDFDPNMDTWPTDYNQMDSLLQSSNTLTVADIQTLTLSLRGYHPIEYIIFGNHGDRKAVNITTRQKQYMLSLATDLNNTCHALYLSWTAAPTNFALELSTAGNGSVVFAKKQEAYLAMVEGMIGICEEVGEGKMKEPFDLKDPQIVESPYSGNSLIDFRNNIVGLQNVYLGKYALDGKGINDLVAAKNISLDNTIQSELTAAINSFSNITEFYEFAIVNQRVQCQQTMQALATLKTTLEDELKPFIIQNIKD
jgi:putative iron-regulated protein